MKKLFYTLAITLFSSGLWAQNAKLEGRITDEKGEGLIQANVIIDAAKGLATVSDYDGNYELSVPAGAYEVTYRYVGKEEVKLKITLKEGEKKVQNMTLKEKARMMDQVVVSGSRYEKKLSEETVSMDVMKGSQLNNQNITDLSAGVQKIPGVTIADGQANIRGGAGWSYGAGSRVAVLYDDLPVTTADADDAKWSTIPMENVEQVEVIKGAASALYGSGALNGIINARTAYPTDKPYTKIQMYGGFYGIPQNKDMKWWSAGQLQYFSGFNIADRRKIGSQVDLTTSGAFTTDRGYLDSSDAHDFRVNAKVRWRVKKVEGLSVGVNVLAYYSWGKTFFVWDSIGYKGYKPLGGTITVYHNGRYIIDPFISYYDKKDNRFTFRYRYLNSTNINTTGQGSIGHRNYAEFQYQKSLKKYNLNIVTGVVGMYDIAAAPPSTDSNAQSLIGNHNRANFAIYAQVDKKFFNRLNATIGLRWEYFDVDKDTTDRVTGKYVVIGRSNSLSSLAYPLGRIGLNYQAAEATFIRVSGGMGFRYPSLAELYVHTQLGPLGVYANPNLKPEKGYGAEIGIKQGFQFGKGSSWAGYADVAGFLNQYNDMMEFTFGLFGPKSQPQASRIGFSSQNIGNARILGAEVLAGVQGKVGQVELGLVAGYTFIDARALDWDKKVTFTTQDGDTIGPTKIFGWQLTNYANIDTHTNKGSNPYLTYAQTSSSSTNTLKYRPKHQFKLLFNLAWKKIDFNFDYQYLSYQENIDYAFVSEFLSNVSAPFTGLKNYRDAKDAAGKPGDHILNLSVGFKPIDKLKIAFIMKNVTNTEWMPRPGRFEAPRNFTLQIGYIF